MVREMHPNPLLSALFRFATLLAVVHVRVLFTPARLDNSFCDLRYDALPVRKCGRVAYSSQEPPPYTPSPPPLPAARCHSSFA